jgi:AAA ATPase domain
MFGRRDRCLLVLSQIAGVPYRHLATLTAGDVTVVEGNTVVTGAAGAWTVTPLTIRSVRPMDADLGGGHDERWWCPLLEAADVFPLIGRLAEVERISAVLGRVEAGHGLVLALSGGSGLGKSRLAQECGAMARARGFLVLSGAGGRYEHDLSYAPLVQALRPLVVGGDPAAGRNWSTA